MPAPLLAAPTTAGPAAGDGQGQTITTKASSNSNSQASLISTLSKYRDATTSSSATTTIPVTGPFTLRLHISGLSPSTTISDLQSRFSSYGLVHPSSISLRRGNHIDEASEPSTYAFLDMDFEDRKKWEALTRGWNGITWRGRKIGVHIAKLDFKQRLEMERQREESKEQIRRRRKELKRKKRSQAKEAPFMRPVDEARVDKGEWGWKKTSTGHLIRPLQLIPSRPIPAPSMPSSTSTSSLSLAPPGTTAKKLKALKDRLKKRARTKALKARMEAGKGKRLRLRVVDPTRYGVRHLGERELIGEVGEGEGEGETRGSWVCVEEMGSEESEEEQEEGEEGGRVDEERIIKWVWIPYGLSTRDALELAQQHADVDADAEGKEEEDRDEFSSAKKRRRLSDVPTSSDLNVNVKVESHHLPSMRSQQLKALGLSLGSEGSGLDDVVVDWSAIKNMEPEDAPREMDGESDLSKLLDGEDGESEGLFSEVEHLDEEEGEGEGEGEVELFSRHGSEEEEEEETGAQDDESPAAPPLPFEAYDPAEESDFSEGYEEGPGIGGSGKLGPQNLNAAGVGGGEERGKMLGLLKGIFGKDLGGRGRTVVFESEAKVGRKAVEDKDEEEEEEEDDYEEVLRIAREAKKKLEKGEDRQRVEVEKGLGRTGKEEKQDKQAEDEDEEMAEDESEAGGKKESREAVDAEPHAASASLSSESSSDSSSDEEEGSDSDSDSDSDSNSDSEGDDDEGDVTGSLTEREGSVKATHAKTMPTSTTTTEQGVRFALPEGEGEGGVEDDDDDDEESSSSGSSSFSDSSSSDSSSSDSPSDSSSSSSDESSSSNEDNDANEVGAASSSPSAQKGVHLHLEQEQEGDGKRPKSDEVKVSSLKDMFRPQEEAKGFSLMSDLALDLGLDSQDLDEELNFGPDDFEMGAEPGQGQGQGLERAGTESLWSTLLNDGAGVGVGRGGGSGTRRFDPNTSPFFFPLFDQAGLRTLEVDGDAGQRKERDVLHLLASEEREKGGFVPFFRTENDDQLDARWVSRRKDLTDDYRRRHREAVKKRKRNVTGSRAQGGTVLGAARR